MVFAQKVAKVGCGGKQKTTKCNFEESLKTFCHYISGHLVIKKNLSNNNKLRWKEEGAWKTSLVTPPLTLVNKRRSAPSLSDLWTVRMDICWNSLSHFSLTDMNCLWHWLEERRVWRNHRTPRFYCVEIKALVRNFTSTACERYQLDVSDGIGRCVLLNSVLGKMSHSVDWPHSIVVKTLTFWLWDYSQTGSIWRLLVLWKGRMWVTSECNNKPLMLFVYSFPSAKTHR